MCQRKQTWARFMGVCDASDRKYVIGGTGVQSSEKTAKAVRASGRVA